MTMLTIFTVAGLAVRRAPDHFDPNADAAVQMLLYDHLLTFDDEVRLIWQVVSISILDVE